MGALDAEGVLGEMALDALAGPEARAVPERGREDLRELLPSELVSVAAASPVCGPRALTGAFGLRCVALALALFRALVSTLQGRVVAGFRPWRWVALRPFAACVLRGCPGRADAREQHQDADEHCAPAAPGVIAMTAR